MIVSIDLYGRDLDDLVKLKELDKDHSDDTYEEYCAYLLKNAIWHDLHIRKNDM